MAGEVSPQAPVVGALMTADTIAVAVAVPETRSIVSVG